MRPRNLLALAIAAVGSTTAITAYGLRPYSAFSLSLGPSCLNINVGPERCSSVFASSSSFRFCGDYVDHRRLLLFSLVALSVSAAVLVRMLLGQTLGSSLLSRTTVIVAVPAAMLGVAAGLWAYSGFGPCSNVYMDRWHAGVAGLGVAVAVLLLVLPVTHLISNRIVSSDSVRAVM